MSSPPQTPAPIKGSWEALLEQANQLDENRNAEALTIYNKMVTRLQKMPSAKLDGMSGRLGQILEETCFRALTLCNSLEQFDDSLGYLDILIERSSDPEEKETLLYVRIRILRMMAQFEKAIKYLTEAAANDEFPLALLYQKFDIYIQMMQPEKARAILDEAEKIIVSAEYQATADPETQRDSLNRFYRLSSISAIELQEWQKSIDYFREASGYSNEGDNEAAYVVYTNLVNRGQYDLALPLIAEESGVIERLFWEGLTRYRLGDEEKASRLWAEILNFDPEAEDSEATFEWIMTHFYTGDKEREGLGMLLHGLNEEDDPAWNLFYFTALGWGIHGNQENTLVNLEYAIDAYRRRAIGRYLPWTYWLPIKDLFDPELRKNVLPYFSEEELRYYVQDFES